MVGEVTLGIASRWSDGIPCRSTVIAVEAGKSRGRTVGRGQLSASIFSECPGRVVRLCLGHPGSLLHLGLDRLDDLGQVLDHDRQGVAGSATFKMTRFPGSRSAMGSNAPVADQRRSAGAPVSVSAFSAAADVPLTMSCSLSRAIVGESGERTPSGTEPGGNSSTYSLCGPFFLRNWGGSAPPGGPSPAPG